MEKRKCEMKIGRRTVYDSKIKPRFEEIAKLVRNGATERSIAEYLGIAYSTFNKYKADRSEFAELLKSSRTTAVNNIENAMYESAVGGKEKIKKAMKIKRIEYKDGKRIREYEEVVPYEEEIYIPPNTTAGIYLLKHWAKEKGYTNDPITMDLKKEELELKRKIAEKDLW